MNRVIHFEATAQDPERAAKFHAAGFGIIQPDPAGQVNGVA